MSTAQSTNLIESFQKHSSHLVEYIYDFSIAIIFNQFICKKNAFHSMQFCLKNQFVLIYYITKKASLLHYILYVLYSHHMIYSFYYMAWQHIDHDVYIALSSTNYYFNCFLQYLLYFESTIKSDIKVVMIHDYPSLYLVLKKKVIFFMYQMEYTIYGNLILRFIM